MDTSHRSWSRTMMVVGIVAMFAGAIDPLEGSVVILAGAGLASLGARLGHSRETPLLAVSFVLILVGVAAMFVLSAFGGIGGTSGHSAWWGLILVPYPVGWVLALVGGFRALREFRRPPHDRSRSLASVRG